MMFKKQPLRYGHIDRSDCLLKLIHWEEEEGTSWLGDYNHPFVRDGINGLSDESWKQLDQLVANTRAQIARSREYLSLPDPDPYVHEELFLQCFRPELFEIAKLQRLFNLVPKPSFTKKYIKINKAVCEMILRMANLQSYIQGAGTVENIIDLRKIRYHNEYPGVCGRSVSFGGYFETDASVVLCRKVIQDQSNRSNILLLKASQIS
ncbi:uncharacterized protein BX664DRAFT_113832 [Halteromyces radiatus]|uniref:uncharacterized protein n=1 Tax=Halteromyces radiatus TaxID=101107 RepID=UPI00221F95BA|nr:uncharacterized protein BX664DRAFT_113832 [Halteromyces radiatus]KAI8093759.1 hypothetical protein BX664DRAFT_113832 [Halteromyces radiatus]